MTRALLTSESCNDAELFWERVNATSLLCVGIIARSLLPTPVRPFCFYIRPSNPRAPSIDPTTYPSLRHCISDVIFFFLFWPIDDSSRFSPITAGITRLSNFALNGAFALLTSAVFTGNVAFAGGIAPSWMHRGDMVTIAVLVGVLGTRVTRVSVAYFGPSLPISHERAVASTTLFSFLISG